MNLLHRSPIHKIGKSHDFRVIKIKRTVLFITYEAYNAVEKFDIEIFNGKEKSYILSIYDIGESPNSTAYVNSIAERELRSIDLFNKAVKMLEKIIQ
jgi:hypothetical protein